MVASSYVNILLTSLDNPTRTRHIFFQGSFLNLNKGDLE